MRILLVDDNSTNLKLLTKLVGKLDNCEALPAVNEAYDTGAVCALAQAMNSLRLAADPRVLHVRRIAVAATSVVVEPATVASLGAPEHAPELAVEIPPQLIQVGRPGLRALRARGGRRRSRGLWLRRLGSGRRRIARRRRSLTRRRTIDG